MKQKSKGNGHRDEFQTRKLHTQNSHREWGKGRSRATLSRDGDNDGELSLEEKPFFFVAKTTRIPLLSERPLPEILIPSPRYTIRCRIKSIIQVSFFSNNFS